MKKYRVIIFLSFISFVSYGQTDSIKNKLPNFWSNSRKYIYSAIYKDSTGKVITKENFTLCPTEKIWEVDNKQTLVGFNLNFNSEDSAKLAPFPQNGILRAWKRDYQEGVIQNDNTIWMHPIRSNQYLLTELAPFPEIRLPIIKDEAWKNTLWIYEAFGTFQGTIENSYTVTGQEQRTYDFGTIACWKILATGIHDKLGTNTVVYYFNEVYGFTEMNYLFYNKQIIEIKLIELKMQ